MYSIGEISKIVKISTDALRYYDEINLLKPCYIEQDSKYRYYSEEQVNELLTIMELKQCGFSLEGIKELLGCKDNSQLLSAFSIQLKKLNKEMSEITAAIDLLKKRIVEIERKEVNNMETVTVLIADVSDFMRMMLKDILGKHSYKVIGEAINGQAAVDLYKEQNPSITIMDIHMAEEQDGITALKKIKSIDENAVVVMLSAICFLSVVLESIKNGASHFVAKPFSVDTLLSALEETLSSHYSCNNEILGSIVNNADYLSKNPNTLLNQDAINNLLRLCASEKIAPETQISDFIKIVVM
jgi:two-component system chemotaxis response regulator CheY